MNAVPNPYCVLGLRLCHCEIRSDEKGEKRTGNATSVDEFFTSVRTSDRIAAVPSVSPASERMQQYARPSLSREWSYSQIRNIPVSGYSRALRPEIQDTHHQDSLFGNSFQSKSFFVVHPEWLSEAVDNTDPEPLHRPPWPWEQPRYRQNIQIPITYTAPEGPETSPVAENGGECAPVTDILDYVPQACPIGYTFTQPGLDMTRPYEKQTQFGAPIVDTSTYRLDN